MTDQYPYPNEETRKNCLERLRKTNRQLEIYNLFLDDAIAQIDAELHQQTSCRNRQQAAGNKQ